MRNILLAVAAAAFTVVLFAAAVAVNAEEPKTQKVYRAQPQANGVYRNRPAKDAPTGAYRNRGQAAGVYRNRPAEQAHDDDYYDVSDLIDPVDADDTLVTPADDLMPDDDTLVAPVAPADELIAPVAPPAVEETTTEPTLGDESPIPAINPALMRAAEMVGLTLAVVAFTIL